MLPWARVQALCHLPGRRRAAAMPGCARPHARCVPASGRCAACPPSPPFAGVLTIESLSADLTAAIGNLNKKLDQGSKQLQHA